MRSVAVLQSFRSISLLLKPNDVQDDFSIPSEYLTDWIARYDELWKNRTGITDGRNLHLLYGRTINAVGDNLLMLSSGVMEIASAANRLGFGFIMHVFLSDCIVRSVILDELLNSALIHTLVLDARNQEIINCNSAKLVSLIESFVRRKVALILYGNLAFWMGVEVLASEHLNGSSFTLVPGTRQTSVRSIKECNYSDRKLQLPMYASSENMTLFDPCAGRFQVIITPDGYLYPCMGLNGLRSCSFGTIFDPIENTIMADVHPSLNFDRLRRLGPELSVEMPRPQTTVEIPITCVRHRDRIENGIAFDQDLKILN